MMEGRIERLEEIRRFLEREQKIAMLKDTSVLLAGWMQAMDETIAALREREPGALTFDEYQIRARRTQNPDLNPEYRLEHATWGLASEVGEALGLLQKMRQGHELDREKMRKEIGDCFWMLAELCDCFGFQMGEIAQENNEKLLKRYPNGFEAERSVHREKGDD